jgi:hypothetical protein
MSECENGWCGFCNGKPEKITPENIRRFNRKFNPMVEDENGQKIRKPYRCPRSGSRYTLADRFCVERRGQWKCSVNDNPMPYRHTQAEIRARVAEFNNPTFMGRPLPKDSPDPETRTIRRSRFRRCKFSLPPHERPRED